MCVGTLYPILLAANACSDDKAAADRKNLLLYFVLASLHQLVPICWWVPFNVEPRVEIKFHGENSTADYCARVAAETSH